MSRPEARECVTWYNDAKRIRSQFEPDWRMASAYVLPRHYQGWQTHEAGPQQAHTADVRRFAYDSTGVNALPKFCAILNRLATPEGMRWHKLRASNEDLMKIYGVRQYFDGLNDRLFKLRYNPRARFGATTGELYASLGVYGCGPFSVLYRKPGPNDVTGGYKYKAHQLKDIFILVDDDDNVVVVFRRFWLNARQFKAKFPKEVDNAPQCIKLELAKSLPSEENYYEFVQVLHSRDDYDARRLDVRQHPICSSYLCVKDAVYVGDEEGYRSLPILTPRTNTSDGLVYGYSPAIQALPALGGVSATKKTMIKAGHKAVDPPQLANDNGVLSGRVDLRPGRVTYGGVSPDGKRLVQSVEMGSFQPAEELLKDDRTDINDAFFVTLFQILLDTPEQTATEVMERVAERAALLAPTMGRLQAEQLGPQIEREIHVGMENGLLPQMPPELIEAQGEYEVVYTSPLAKSMHAEEVSGFMRWYEMLLKASEVAAASGSNDLPLDWADMDAAAPNIAEYMAVRTGWVKDTKAVDITRKARADAKMQSELIKQAPAAAAVAKEAMKNGTGSAGVPGVAN